MAGIHQPRFQHNKRVWRTATLADVHRFIADYGAVNQPDERGWAPVHWAARWGDRAMMQALIDAGAEIELFDSRGHMALHLAARWGNCEAVRCLLANGADIHAMDSRGAGVLHLAADRADTAELAGMLEAAETGTDYVPPEDPEVWGNAEMITLLLGEGAEIDGTDDYDRTALHYASDNLITLGALLGAGAEINARDETGKTPLMRMVRLGSAEAVRFLLAHGADPALADMDGLTSFDIAEETEWLADEAVREVLAQLNKKLRSV